MSVLIHIKKSDASAEGSEAIVYFTKDISPEGLIKIYEALGVDAKGYGKQIMLEGINAAREHFGAERIDIEEQEYARGYYEQVGFRQSSEPFILDGIPHIRMTWTLQG